MALSNILNGAWDGQLFVSKPVYIGPEIPEWCSMTSEHKKWKYKYGKYVS